jgi:hypothetical protein
LRLPALFNVTFSFFLKTKIMSNPTFNAPNSTPPKANKNSLIILGILLGLLLISNVVYYFVKKPVSAAQVNQQVETAVSEQKASYAELEMRYQAASAQLDSLRIIIPGMEQRITEQQAQLEQQRQQIAAKIESGDYAGARQQIEDLNRQKDAFILEAARLRQEVTTLRTEVSVVTDQKTQLESNNQALNQQLDAERQVNATLVSEKVTIQTERDQARTQVEAQTFLALSQVSVRPVKVSKKGKATSVKNHRDADQFKICFQVTPSDLVPNGTETFYLQILNGQTTIGTDSPNSGTIRDKKTGKEFAYTARMECPYSGTPEEFCGTWAPANGKFSKGTYQVVVWHRGRQVGSQTLSLK